MPKTAAQVPDTVRFLRDGFLVVPRLADAALQQALRASAAAALDPLQGPVEYESDVGYPGGPRSRKAVGGNTPRRLLYAYSRDQSFRAWARNPSVLAILKQLLGSVALSQCHHNCVMTKHPGHSSMTDWHQDIRYWSFDAPELISVWLALGTENQQNGALSVIPGSHQLDLERGRLDRYLFLRPELAHNQALIRSAICIELSPGDTLLFHCRLFHAAGNNRSDAIKLSLVYTYHAQTNPPIAGTRSAHYPSVLLA